MPRVSQWIGLALLIVLGLGVGGAMAQAPDAATESRVQARAKAKAEAETEHAGRMAALGFLVGNFEMRPDAPEAGITMPRSRFGPILGGRYLELQGHAFDVDFRLTLGWDAPHRQYRLTLLDSGSGALDVYGGQFDTEGQLVLTNDHHFRIHLRPRPDGWTWIYQGSRDQGQTWQASGPAQIARRVAD